MQKKYDKAAEKSQVGFCSTNRTHIIIIMWKAKIDDTVINIANNAGALVLRMAKCIWNVACAASSSSKSYRPSFLLAQPTRSARASRA
jgi:hypothetical protein